MLMFYDFAPHGDGANNAGPPAVTHHCVGFIALSHSRGNSKTAPCARRSADNDVKTARESIPGVAHFRVAIGWNTVAAFNSARDLAGRGRSA